MKVRIKAPFYDVNGIHKKGDVIDTESFDSALMEIVEGKTETVEKAVAKTPKKTTRKKD